MILKFRVIAICWIFTITGCIATGERFSSPKISDNAMATVYFMRQSKFVGMAICRDILIDEKKYGCIKDGGFFRVEVSPGTHSITVPKVNNSDWANISTASQNFEPGSVYYYEWTHSLDNFYVLPLGAIVVIGGKSSASLIKHTEESALPVLKNLKNSVR